jgi:hypothetical protein
MSLDGCPSFPTWRLGTAGAHRWEQLLVPCVLPTHFRRAALAVLVVLVSLIAARPAHAAVFPINEPFTETTLPAPWVSGGSAQMTGDGTIDPIGQGWLRLTSATANQFGYVYYNTAFPSANGIVISFDYADYGGTGADGLAFFLIDGSYGGAFAPGPAGGSLGYASCPGSASTTSATSPTRASAGRPASAPDCRRTASRYVRAPPVTDISPRRRRRRRSAGRAPRPAT